MLIILLSFSKELWLQGWLLGVRKKYSVYSIILLFIISIEHWLVRLRYDYDQQFSLSCRKFFVAPVFRSNLRLVILQTNCGCEAKKKGEWRKYTDVMGYLFFLFMLMLSKCFYVSFQSKNWMFNLRLHLQLHNIENYHS